MDAHLSFSFWAHASSTLRLIYFLSTVLSQERERGSYKSHVFSSSIKSRANPAITCAWCITSCQSYSGYSSTTTRPRLSSVHKTAFLKALFCFGLQINLLFSFLLVESGLYMRTGSTNQDEESHSPLFAIFYFLIFFSVKAEQKTCFLPKFLAPFLHLTKRLPRAFGCVLLFQATFRCNPILKMHFAVFPSCSWVLRIGKVVCKCLQVSARDLF